MKIRLARNVLIAAVTLALPLLGQAASVTLKTADASGWTSFNTGTNWSSGVAPTTGNDYFTTTTVILNTSGMRTPPDAANYTFGGSSLTLTWPGNGNYSMIEKSSAGSGAGRTLTINNFTNAGGLMRSGGNNGSLITVTGNMMVVTTNATINGDQCNWIINSPLIGSGVILTNGSTGVNTVSYGGNNSGYTGKIFMSGVVAFNAQNSIPANPAAFTPDQIMLSGGTLKDSLGLTFNNANAGITLLAASTINTANAISNTIVAEPITGSFGLSKTGAGTLTLSGSNSFTGGFTLQGATVGATLNINSTNALGTGTFTINSGDLSTIDNTNGSALTLLANNAQAWNNNFTFKGSSSLNLGTGAVTLGANRVITNTANTLTVGGTISGAFSLTKTGAGTLSLTASNGYTGGTTLNQGTLVMGNTNALGTNGITLAGTANAVLDIATDGNDYTNALNAGSSTSWTIAPDVKTGNTGINHNMGSFSIGSGATPLTMSVVRGPNVTSGSSSITALALILSGGSGGTTIIAPTTASVSFGNMTPTVTSKTLQLDGTNTGNAITGVISDNGGFVISLLKTNTSTWTLSGANTSSGSTTVGQGTLAIGSGGSLSSPLVTINSGAILDVSASTYALGSTETLSGNGTVNGNFSDSTGSQITPGGSGAVGVLTFNNNLTLAAGDTNKFDFATGTNDQIIVNGNLNPSVGSVINLASLPAGGLVNGTYTLFTVNGTLGGSAGNFTITGKPTPSRQTFSIVYASSPNRVQLQVSGSAASLVWGGTASAWDIVTTQDWTNSATLNPDFYFDGDNVNFTDAGSAISPILNVNVQPGSVTVNSANTYSISGNGAINGSAGLTKSGNGTVTITTTNSYTGITAINGGVVSVNTITNSGIPSPIGAASSASGNLSFNGGTLQYTGDSTVTDHGATLNAGGGTLQVSTSTAALAVNGVITGSNGGALTKSGNGTLVVTAGNTYNGNTTINGGTLQIGNGGGTGNLGSGNNINNNGTLLALRTGTLAVTNAINGSGSIINNGTGILALSGNNTYTGETLVNTGTVQVVSATGLGGTPAAFDATHITVTSPGTLEASANISLSDTNSGVTVNAGTIAVDSGMTLTISNVVNAPVSLTKSSPGTLILSGNNNFAGVLNVDTGIASANDGEVRVTSQNALGNVPTIQIRDGQISVTSGLQIDGTLGAITVSQAFSWTGRNSLNPAIENFAGNNIWNPSSVALNVGGTFYQINSDAGDLTIPATFPTTVPTTGRTFIFGGAGNIDLTGTFQNGSGGALIGLLKTNSGALTLWAGQTYSGLTTVAGGTLNAADGSSFGVTTTNIEIAPLAGETSVMNISNATVSAQRIIIAGITANNTSPGNGTINQFNGSVSASQWVTIGSGGSSAGNVGGTGVYNLSGGSLNVQNTAGGTQLEVANFTSATGTLNISGLSTTLNIENNAFISLGANGGAGNGTVNQSSGTVTFFSDAGSTSGGNGILYLGKAAGLTNNYTYNLNGGTLVVPTIAAVSGNSLFNFNGGTLVAAKTNATWMAGLTNAYVSASGGTIDSASYPVTIPQPLLHNPALGGTADGGLTVQSSASTGVLTLAGTNTYTGPTTINSGTLNVNGVIGSGAVMVNSGGTLGGSGVVSGSTTLASGAFIAPAGAGVIGTLTISNGLALQGGTVQYDMTRSSNDVLTVSGAVNVSGATTILLAFPSPNVGTYTLINYGSLSGFANLTLALTSPNPRFSFSLVNNAGAKAIQVVVTGNSANLAWKGDGSFNGWDNAGTYQNWLKGATPDFFYDGDNVTFNDTGSDTPSISIQGTVSPSSVTVNATQSYDFGASGGSLAGTGGLTKGGSGTLTLEENNTYSGATFINGGTLQVGNAGASGSLGSGVISNTASLVFDRSDAIVMPTPIYGTGSVAMSGIGTLTASGSNYYTGPTLINSGIVYVSNASGLGATNGAITVASGGQLYITAQVDNGGNPLSIAGTGDGNGALRKGGSSVSTYNGALTLTGNSTIVADGGATLNLASPSGLNGTAANANLTLAGGGAGVVSGPLALGTGGLTVSAGTWTMGPSNSFTGLTTLSGGTTRITGGSLGNPSSFTANQIAFSGGSLEAITNATFNDGNAGFTLNNNATITVDSGFTLGISNQITGSATLTKAAAGTLVLSGNNSSLNGLLNIDTASSSANDGAVRITTSNAILNVSQPMSVRNNNSGSSTLQLDGTAGPISLPLAFNISCRNNGTPWVESIAGNNVLSGAISVFQGGSTMTFQCDAGQLEVDGTISYTGSLNGTRTYSFAGAGNHLVTGNITGPTITNAPINLAMNGTGKLTLTGTETYGDITTVNSGLLLLDGSLTSTGGVTVAGGTLGGTGTITDAVNIGAAGTLSPGDSAIGTLTISGNLALAGTTYIEVNKTASTADHVVGVNNLTYGGTLFATNLSGTLNVGDNFTIFTPTTHSGNFATITGSPGAGKAWSFNPATGVLSVINGVNTNPTNVVATVSGSTLTLTWPTDHIGWRLQVQTNTLNVGLNPASNAWVTVPGSTSVNTVNVSLGSAKGAVFYRMVYP